MKIRKNNKLILAASVFLLAASQSNLVRAADEAKSGEAEPSSYKPNDQSYPPPQGGWVGDSESIDEQKQQEEAANEQKSSSQSAAQQGPAEITQQNLSAQDDVTQSYGRQNSGLPKVQQPQAMQGYNRPQAQQPQAMQGYGRPQAQQPQAMQGYGRPQAQQPQAMQGYGRPQAQQPQAMQGYGRPQAQQPQAMQGYGRPQAQQPQGMQGYGRPQAQQPQGMQGYTPRSYGGGRNMPWSSGRGPSFSGPWDGGRSMPWDSKRGGRSMPWQDSGRGGWMNKDRFADGWDDMLNAPSDMGEMPGGFTAPSISVPNPVDVGEQFDDAARDVPGQMRNVYDENRRSN
jgi:hypothetical protein